MAKVVEKRPVEVDARYIQQNATFTIRDIYDAAVEVITNPDDRYQILGIKGRIDIEVERHQSPDPSLFRVRDHADGMTSDVMRERIGRLGGRVSGMAEGKPVRGGNSRGAKDVAALGDVMFESIAEDGRFHRCVVDRFLEFSLHEPEPVTGAVRKRLKLPKGTGTVVTLAVRSEKARIPRHDSLKKDLSRLVALRDILSNPNRTVRLIDESKNRVDELRAPQRKGVDKVKETFEVPGYPGVTAKLVIRRAAKRFEQEKGRFRLGGILLKSSHAIHGATLFDTELERDPHAAWFFGRLTCDYIETLWNEYDQCNAARTEPPVNNCVPIVDPSRREGLTRDHPFVAALYAEARKRLRPLVEAEKQLERGQKAKVESEATRRRLNRLQKAASKFMRDHVDEPDTSRDSTSSQLDSAFRKRGYSLSPPYAQVLVGHSQNCALNVSQESFPELEVGSAVEIQCLSDELEANKHAVGLENHPSRDGVLRATWKIKAIKPTLATGVRVRVGSISAESTFEVLETEKNKYEHVNTLRFERKRYSVTAGSQKKKRVRLLAPLALVESPLPVVAECSSSHFTFGGEMVIAPSERFGIAVCDLLVQPDGKEASAKITVQVDGMTATCEMSAQPAPGAGLAIEIVPANFGNHRSKWTNNLLEIAALHPSLERYLGLPEDGFPGQEEKHFRLLLAEIVSDAICSRVVGRNVEANPEEYEDADWDQYFAEYSRLMTEFLPIAHKLQFPL